MSAFIPAFGRSSKGSYLDHIAKRYVENKFFLKAAVRSKKEGNRGQCHHIMGVRTDAPAKTVKEIITKLAA